MADQERETMELDAVFVGAGLANLAAAYSLMKGIEKHNEEAKRNGLPTHVEPPTVLVIDKANAVGNHSLSGAVVDPSSLRELFPELKDEEFPFISPVKRDTVCYLTPGGQFPIPAQLLPAAMHNHGNFIVSVAEMTRWMAAKCEEVGVEVYTEFAATELLREGDKITGVRIGDKGLEKDGHPGPTFSPGMDLLAKVTVLGEGTRGYLAQQLIKDFELDRDANPQIWGLGIKELIEIPAGRIEKGSVIHTLGFPFDLSTYGGTFTYALEDTLVAVGLVFGLDYPNPLMESHGLFLRFKKHPTIAKIIEGGKVVEYGAKTLPEGGFWALPRLAVDGAVMVGDSAGFLNCMRLKGIHLAIKSGMLAGQKVARSLIEGNTSAAALDYRLEFDASPAGQEMKKVRNFRQWFHHGAVAGIDAIPGFLSGMGATGLEIVTGGALPSGRKTTPRDHEGLRPASAGMPTPKTPTDEALYLDLLTDVYKSGSLHREEQPCHCKILDTEACKRCNREYASPCTKFCPAKVYEEELDADGRFQSIRVNFSNCVHCKTCEIKDPLENIRWTPPEGGDGPKYRRM
jgi:electron-transferring-flavoprotein dehydrogenase